MSQKLNKNYSLILRQIFTHLLSQWDEEAEENAAHEYKLSLLDSMEANWRTAVCNNGQDSSYYASSYYSWFSYGSGLVTNIIENIQVALNLGTHLAKKKFH